MNTPFPVQLRRREFIGGLIWLLIYLFVLSTLLQAVLELLGLDLDVVALNGVYYILCFVVTAVLFWSFLTDSLSVALSRPGRLVIGVLLGYGAYIVLELVLSLVYSLWVPELTVPNDDSIRTMAGMNYALMTAAAVLLAPLTEETLLRGFLFGSLRRWNRAAAYVVTALIFAAMHVMGYVFQMDVRTLLLNIPLYMLPGMALCLSYEYAGTVWAPILLHMFINALSMLAMGQQL